MIHFKGGIKIKKLCILLLIFIIVINICSCYNNVNYSESRDIGNIYAFGHIAAARDKLYFLEEDNGEVGLYTSDFKLKNKEKICDGYYACMNIYKDKIYYADIDGFVHSMNADGTQKRQLIDFCIDYLYVYDKRIYCIVTDANLNLNEDWKDNEYNLISMNIDGGDIRILCNKEIKRFYIYKNQIYYVYYDTGYHASHRDKGYFRRMNLDGTEDELLFEFDDLVLTFSIYKDYIYYICPPGYIVKKSISGEDDKEYIQDNDILQYDYLININNPYILYCGGYMGYFVYNMDTGEKKNILYVREEPDLHDNKNDCIYDTSFGIVNDKAYFYQNGKLEYISLKE